VRHRGRHDRPDPGAGLHGPAHAPRLVRLLSTAGRRASAAAPLRIWAVSLPDGLPYLLGCERHVQVTHPEVAECVDGSVLDGRRGADRPRFTDALDAKGVVR